MIGMDPDGMVIERIGDVDDVDASRDLDSVAALEAASFTNPWTREMLYRELRQSDVARVYVLRLPGHRVAAFCACWCIYDELHINTIAVDPNLRRSGLASALMKHLMADAARQGARRALLEVRRSNFPAQRLYERLGFIVAGVRRSYYTQPDEDALLLLKEGLSDNVGAEPQKGRDGL
jgi:ribosomal-protein-alanine N-acetyltransferase